MKCELNTRLEFSSKGISLNIAVTNQIAASLEWPDLALTKIPRSVIGTSTKLNKSQFSRTETNLSHCLFSHLRRNFANFLWLSSVCKIPIRNEKIQTYKKLTSHRKHKLKVTMHVKQLSQVRKQHTIFMVNDFPSHCLWRKIHYHALFMISSAEAKQNL